MAKIKFATALLKRRRRAGIDLRFLFLSVLSTKHADGDGICQPPRPDRRGRIEALESSLLRENDSTLSTA
jgi:hypothetical protein